MHNPLFNFTGAVFVRPALSTPLSRLPGPSPWPSPWRMPTNMSLTWPFALTMAQALADQPGREPRSCLPGPGGSCSALTDVQAGNSKCRLSAVCTV